MPDIDDMSIVSQCCFLSKENFFLDIQNHSTMYCDCIQKTGHTAAVSISTRSSPERRISLNC